MLVFSLGLLIVSNLVLQTRTVREWMESKLERRLGFEWTVGSLSWTPWTGVQMRDLAAEIRDLDFGDSAGVRPIYELDLDVQISWRALLSRRVEVRELRVRKGKVAIPLELLSLLPREREQAANRDNQPPGGGDSQGEQTPEKKATEESDKPDTRTAPSGKQERPPARPAVILRIDRCDVGFYSIHGSGKGELVLHKLRGEFPLQGEDASGSLRHDGLTFGSSLLMSEMEMPVLWRRPFLRLPARTFKWEGVSLNVEGFIRLVGTPRFLVNLDAPAAPMRRVSLASWSGIEAEAASVQGQGSLQGTLTALDSWRGNFSGQLSALGLVQRSGEIRKFEYGRVSSSMRGGVFRIVDARLHSEQLSFLGNGVLLPDGRVRGTLRLVADSGHAEAITRFAVGARLTGGWTRSWFKPLVTPDRQFRDLHVHGTVNRAVVDVGRHGEELEVGEVRDRVVAFVKRENEEKKQQDEAIRPMQPQPGHRAILPPTGK